jgi:NCS1 family nucleobase:cation symporter-1
MILTFVIISLVLSLAVQDQFYSAYNAFVAIMTYLLVPWSAINLVDFYIIRKGHYDVSGFFAADGGEYGRYNLPALVVFALGFLVQIPFFVTGFYVGPIAEALGGVDVAWLVGLVVSAVLYWQLATRKSGRNQEALAPPHTPDTSVEVN